jgi:acyl-CoA thioesterase-1
MQGNRARGSGTGAKRTTLLGAAVRLLAGVALVVAATSAYSAPKNLLVLGDSLSAEYGLQRGTGWTGLLQQRLQQTRRITRWSTPASAATPPSAGATACRR